MIEVPQNTPMRLDLSKTDAAGEVVPVMGSSVLIQLVTNTDFTGDFVVAVYVTSNGADTDQRIWTFNAAGRMDYAVAVLPGESIRLKVLDAATTGTASVFFTWGSAYRATQPVNRTSTLNANSAAAVAWWPTNGYDVAWFRADSSGATWGTAIIEVVYRADEDDDWHTPVPAVLLAAPGTAVSVHTQRIDVLGYPQVGLRVNTVEGGAETLAVGVVLARLQR